MGGRLLQRVAAWAAGPCPVADQGACHASYLSELPLGPAHPTARTWGQWLERPLPQAAPNRADQGNGPSL